MFDLIRNDKFASKSSITPPSGGLSKAETTFYYSGISYSPPKLVYRTSKDHFALPSGPEAYRRLKHLLPVYGHELGGKWGTIRPKVRDLLDEQQVRFSTIDLVRFRTIPRQGMDAIISPLVIWVGVVPESLLFNDASKSASTILELLKDEGVTDVDVEFRESVFRRSAGATLYKPPSDEDPRRSILDPLTTALGVPIAAAETPHMQGMMGFYFQDGQDLYGVTARHVLFPAEDNLDYIFHPGMPKKEVLVMGTEAWADYLKSVKTRMKDLAFDVEINKRRIVSLERRAEGDTPDAKQAQRWLRKTRELMREGTETIAQLQEFYERTEQDFGDQCQRVIGHIVWAPAITAGTAPNDFTQDVCVVKLDKARFLPNFKGNRIDLGLRYLVFL